jgi:hypothetical protein
MVAEIERTAEKVHHADLYENARERYQAFLEMCQKRTWIELIMISKVMKKLDRQLIINRADRPETVSLNENATLEERESFRRHRQHLYEEMKRRPGNNKDIQLFDMNVYVARMKWKFRRKQIAAHMIRVSLLGFIDIQTMLRAAKNYKDKVCRCQRIVRNYLIAKRAREKLLDLQFAKVESVIRKREREALASDLLKTSSSMNLALSASLMKEMSKVRLESLKRYSGFRKKKYQTEESQYESLIPESMRITVIREDLTIRKKLFVKRVMREEKARAMHSDAMEGRNMYYRFFRAKPHFKTMIKDEDMFMLVAQARKLAGENLHRPLLNNT